MVGRQGSTTQRRHDMKSNQMPEHTVTSNPLLHIFAQRNRPRASTAIRRRTGRKTGSTSTRIAPQSTFYKLPLRTLRPALPTRTRIIRRPFSRRACRAQEMGEIKDAAVVAAVVAAVAVEVVAAQEWRYGRSRCARRAEGGVSVR